MNISGFDEEALVNDLRMLGEYPPGSTNLFVAEALPVFKEHLAAAMDAYQTKLLEDLSDGLRLAVIDLMLKNKRAMKVNETVETVDIEQPKVNKKEATGGPSDW